MFFLLLLIYIKFLCSLILSDEEESGGAGGAGWEEILTWLVEVGAEGEGDAEGSEGESGRGTARLSWSAKVSSASGSGSTTEETPHEHRVNTRLDIEKDDIQAVLPISKVTANFFCSFGSVYPHNNVMLCILTDISPCFKSYALQKIYMKTACRKLYLFYLLKIKQKIRTLQIILPKLLTMYIAKKNLRYPM